MIKGRQFFAHEMIPVLQAANNYACTRFIGSMDFEDQPPDQAIWRKACGDLTALLAEANQRADADEMATGLTPTYTETSMWWQAIAFALAPFAAVPEVVTAVAALPVDESPLPGPTWMFPLALGLGVLATVGAAYWWTRR